MYDKDAKEPKGNTLTKKIKLHKITKFLYH
jgi:hypothetical protein